MTRRTIKAAGVTSLLVVLTGGGIVLANGRLNTSGRPNFGEREVAPGFVPDPITVNLTSGGNLDVSTLNVGAGCVGWATSQPDFRFRLKGTSRNLRVYVRASADTTLVVNKANGQWACNDDSYGGHNPTVDLPNAVPGQYDVWVGSYRQGEQVRAVLHITELSSNHP